MSSDDLAGAIPIVNIKMKLQAHKWLERVKVASV
jgi:hypothetical protein